MTLEAFADTIIPGEKRWPGDRAVAGISEGGGAVAAGALMLLEMPEGGMENALDDLAEALNAHADEYRERHALAEDGSVPPFVALSAEQRVALVVELTTPGHPEKELWTGLALFCNMAFDTGAHSHTVDALREGHPGLVTLGFAAPDSDGLWRFPDFSYRERLASPHPDTTPTGSPA
ncbi:DUF5987 family protein [Streptomyces sedi]|uniref:Regulator n=1 Tax=Streptomyces sedi TaxID=555059 RepID=A0A5C4VFR6_9ACTN|nr:DUF5987 family protein [Streptomyces sedi]TNM34638.1 regulator [Streptomyces sedi]